MENNEFENQPEVQQEPKTTVFQEPVYEMPVVENTADNTQNTVASRNFLDEMKDGAANLIDKAKQSGAADSAREFIDKAKQSSAADGARNLLGKVKQIPKTVWIIAAAAIAAIVALVLILGATTNTYKTPLDLTVKIFNAKKVDKMLDLAANSLNGVCEKEVKEAIKILKKTDAYKDNKDDIQDQLDEALEMIEEEYGSNYKVTYKITEKEKIDKDDCEDYEDQLKALGKQAVNAAKDVDSDMIEEMSEYTDISKSDCKKLVKLLEEAGKELKKAKVTAGYELEVTLMVKGSEVDEPEEMELSLNVYKVNGRWMLDYVSLAQSYIGMIMGSLNLGF